jgi:DNA primase catalytic core
MARIPQTEIERLKHEIALERLVEASGIELKRAGKDLLGRCPFHDDTEASLVVTPAKNLWHCFGCQLGGGPIDWVIKTNGVSFRHAVELLRSDPQLAAGAQALKRGTIRKLAAPLAFDADDQALLNQVVGYYHETLKASPEALAYLESRGIANCEAIERFKLGYANRTLGLRLPEKNRKEGAEIRARLEKLGLYRASGHEHFNGSLTIPVIDDQGNVREVYGRKITAHLRPGTPLHLYLPGPHRGVWNEAVLVASKEVILCEALIDALTFWCAGYRNVTSAYGIEGFTDDHLSAFKRHGTKRVLIAYDRDEPGERAAAKLAEKVMAEAIEAWRIQFPHGMDANDYALKVTPATKSLGVVMRKALWLGKGAAPKRDETASAAAQVEITNCDLQSAIASPAAASACESHARVHAPAASSLAADLAAKKETAPILTVDALPATPLPTAPAAEVEAQVSEAEIVITFGDRRYRVRGLAKNLAFEVLKVNVLAARGEAFYVDTLDLYSAKHRAAFVTHAAIELQVTEDVIKTDLGKVLLELEALQARAIRKTLEPTMPAAVVIAESERAQALELLRAPELIERILADLEACGLVGERTNKLVAYLAATSRKLDSPLAVLVQSSSAAGKSTLMDAVLALMPEEERVKYSAMTGQSLFYIGNGDLKHKILAIAEEEGASRAAYALKLLHSEGELTIASTGKDPQTGNLVTQEYRVEGPTMIFTTTTAIDVDEELKNRCLVLAVDESRAQTQAIHGLQREKRTLEGLMRKAKRKALLTLHQNAQRLLRPLDVLNPYAERLTFPDQATRTRRDHEKYLTLIDTIALLHQHQRTIKTTQREGQRIEYVEATLDDIALANALAHEVLGHSLDELPPQTRRLLTLLDTHVRAECARQAIARSAYRFSRRTLREAIGLSDTQLRVHLERLVELEYVIARRDGAGGRFVYELVYDGGGEDGRAFVPGLIDVEALAASPTTTKVAGAKSEVVGRLRGVRGPLAAGSRGDEIALSPERASDSEQSHANATKTHIQRGNGTSTSYPHDAVVTADDPVALAASPLAADRA